MPKDYDQTDMTQRQVEAHERKALTELKAKIEMTKAYIDESLSPVDKSKLSHSDKIAIKQANLKESKSYILGTILDDLLECIQRYGDGDKAAFEGKREYIEQQMGNLNEYRHYNFLDRTINTGILDWVTSIWLQVKQALFPKDYTELSHTSFFDRLCNPDTKSESGQLVEDMLLHTDKLEELNLQESEDLVLVM